jgi:chromosome segregation ATPase
MEHLEREVAKIKERRGELNECLTKLSTANDRTDTELTNFRNEYRRVQDQYEKILQGELASATDLNDIETEIVYLRQRK